MPVQTTVADYGTKFIVVAGLLVFVVYAVVYVLGVRAFGRSVRKQLF